MGHRLLVPAWRPRQLSVLVVAAASLLNPSCGDDAPRARTPAVVWRKLGAWSGRGSMQTEPFISNTGSLRLQWETRNEAAAGTGTFRVTVHSDVSGRPLVLAVDARGVGRDITHVIEDPRSFFLAVESANLDWTLAAEEGIAATGPAAK
jgi:hypothetical protein